MESFKDPVCGMNVPDRDRFTASYGGKTFSFCSEFCQRAFERNPERYVEALVPTVTELRKQTCRIAYFSMEIAVESDMPNYSGGLGVLAGDTLKSCADLGIPIVGVSLLYKDGYFEQRLDEWGNQSELPVRWDPSRFCRLLPARVHVSIEGREVIVQAWQYDIPGVGGHRVPVLLLDTDVEGNSLQDRALTRQLYGGDDRYRLAQEIVLGVGGVRMLRAAGFTAVRQLHMNEGHAALLVLELLRENQTGERADWDFDGVRRRCVFTTHTPVPAGHDQFPYDLFRQVAGELVPMQVLKMLAGEDRLNMTLLALNISHYVNGVAKKHGEVSRAMFAGYPIDSITNGVHSRTWTSKSFKELYDRYIPGWRNDPFSLRYAISIPRSEIWAAHLENKRRLCEEVLRRTGKTLDPDVLTIGFARRATPYKRADLLFHQLDELTDMVNAVGPIQVVFAGKAHPRDEGGKELIRRIFEVARQLDGRVPVVYLENYNMDLGLLLTAGADVWLNTPLRPLEASGTSGMKAAHNGVPSLSVLDGWWIEGHIEGVTGWAIGPAETDTTQPEATTDQDAQDLYRKLRTQVIPTFYANRDQWIDIMRQAIAFNASFFNTHRMVQQYAANAYL